MKFCKNCGSQIKERTKFCGECGASVNVNIAQKSNKKLYLIGIGIVIGIIALVLLFTVIGRVSNPIVGKWSIINSDGSIELDGNGDPVTWQFYKNGTLTFSYLDNEDENYDIKYEAEDPFLTISVISENGEVEEEQVLKYSVDGNMMTLAEYDNEYEHDSMILKRQ